MSSKHLKEGIVQANQRRILRLKQSSTIMQIFHPRFLTIKISPIKENVIAVFRLRQYFIQ